MVEGDGIVDKKVREIPANAAPGTRVRLQPSQRKCMYIRISKKIAVRMGYVRYVCLYVCTKYGNGREHGYGRARG